MKQVSELNRTWNLVLVLQIVQMISGNYCAWLYPSIRQVWWLNELWFKSYILKCILSVLLTIIVTTHGKSWDSWKYKNLNILRTEIKKKKKNLNLCLRWNILCSHGFLPEVTFNSVRNILSYFFALHSDWASTALKSS